MEKITYFVVGGIPGSYGNRIFLRRGIKCNTIALEGFLATMSIWKSFDKIIEDKNFRSWCGYEFSETDFPHVIYCINRMGANEVSPIYW